MQGKEQWKDGKMDGVLNNRKINTTGPSKPERIMLQILGDLSIPYIFQFRPEGYSKIYDFYIPLLNLLIEFDGVYWHSLPENIKRDKEKTKYAKNNGYELLRFNEKTLNNFQNIMKEKYHERIKSYN